MYSEITGVWVVLSSYNHFPAAISPAILLTQVHLKEVTKRKCRHNSVRNGGIKLQEIGDHTKDAQRTGEGRRVTLTLVLMAQEK